MGSEMCIRDSYNTEKEAEAFVESVLNIRRRMGYDE